MAEAAAEVGPGLMALVLAPGTPAGILSSSPGAMNFGLNGRCSGNGIGVTVCTYQRKNELNRGATDLRAASWIAAIYICRIVKIAKFRLMPREMLSG